MRPSSRRRPLSAGPVPRIGFRELVQAAPVLRDRGEPHIADGLERAATDFCEALAEHRCSTAWRGRLSLPADFGLDALLTELRASADVLELGDPEAVAVARGCRALAHRLGVLLRPVDPDRWLVLVNIDREGLGELLSVARPMPTDTSVGSPDPLTAIHSR